MAKRGRPTRGQGLNRHSLITFLDRVSISHPPFMGEPFEQSQIVFKSNGTFAQLAAVINGLGIAELPCCIADSSPELERIWPDEPPTPYPIWLVTHEDLRRAAKIRLVSAAIVKEYEERRKSLRNGLGSGRPQTSLRSLASPKVGPPHSND